MDIIVLIKKLPKYLAYPMLFTCLIIIFTCIINLLFGIDFGKYYSLIFCMVSSCYLCYYVNKSVYKSYAISICYLAGDLLLHSFCGVHYSFIIGLLINLALIYASYKLNTMQTLVLSLIIMLILSTLLGNVYDYLYTALLKFATVLSGKGSLFGSINVLYNLLFGSKFELLFYHKAFSQSQYIKNNIVTGVVDIFSKTYSAPSHIVAKYLSGEYVVNIFINTGLLLFLFNKLNKNQKCIILLSLILSIIFGNNIMFSLFILILNPLLFCAYLVLTFIAFTACNLIDIRLGFVNAPSIIELFKYNSSFVYFIITGLVILILSYFTTSLVMQKFDFASHKVLPPNAKKIVKYLGGDKNINHIANNIVYVNNPNLINILQLDCDISGTQVKLKYGDYDIIKNFY